MSRFTVRECFYSLQGEGARAGTANVFLRFAGCNLACRVEREGFNCDTDFSFGDKLDLVDVIDLVRRTDAGGCKNVILTGGEPTLQMTPGLVEALHAVGYFVAVETNGLRPIKARCCVGDESDAVDYVACSPKRGHRPVLQHADEVRVVVGPGDEPDAQGVDAIASDRYFVSPAWYAPDVASAGYLIPDTPDRDALAWAIEVCKRPVKRGVRWRLSVQQHKWWGVE